MPSASVATTMSGETSIRRSRISLSNGIGRHAIPARSATQCVAGRGFLTGLRELQAELSESCARAALPERDRELVLVVGRQDAPGEGEAALRAALGPVAADEEAVQVEVRLAAARVEGERQRGPGRVDGLEPEAR